MPFPRFSPLALAAPKPSKPLPQPVRKTAARPPTQHIAKQEPLLGVPAATPQVTAPDAVLETVGVASSLELPSEPAPPAAAKIAEVQPEPIEQPRFNADYLDNLTPAYPRLSRRLGEEGRVLLRVQVGTAGTAAQVLLIDSLAGAMMLLSITGVLLWTRMRGSRLTLAGLCGGSLGLALLFVLQTVG